jgi:hypothetical protein
MDDFDQYPPPSYEEQVKISEAGVKQPDLPTNQEDFDLTTLPVAYEAVQDNTHVGLPVHPAVVLPVQIAVVVPVDPPVISNILTIISISCLLIFATLFLLAYFYLKTLTFLIFFILLIIFAIIILYFRFSV